MSKRWLRAICAAALIAIAGCSFAGVRSKPSAGIPDVPRCSSAAAPTADLIAGLAIATASVIAGVTIANRYLTGENVSDRKNSQEFDGGVVAGGGLAIASLPLASALYGTSQRRHCRNIFEMTFSARRDEIVDRVRGLEAANQCDAVMQLVRASSDPVLKKQLSGSTCVRQHDEKWTRCVAEVHGRVLASADVTERKRLSDELTACGAPPSRPESARAARLFVDVDELDPLP